MSLSDILLNRLIQPITPTEQELVSSENLERTKQRIETELKTEMGSLYTSEVAEGAVMAERMINDIREGMACSSSSSQQGSDVSVALGIDLATGKDSTVVSCVRDPVLPGDGYGGRISRQAVQPNRNQDYFYPTYELHSNTRRFIPGQTTVSGTAREWTSPQATPDDQSSFYDRVRRVLHQDFADTTFIVPSTEATRRTYEEHLSRVIEEMRAHPPVITFIPEEAEPRKQEATPAAAPEKQSAGVSPPSTEARRLIEID